tara:strand:- start:195 stop:371 length:177 start_codon:yes stop_codon:yes gene_type:complete
MVMMVDKVDLATKVVAVVVPLKVELQVVVEDMVVMANHLQISQDQHCIMICHLLSNQP